MTWISFIIRYRHWFIGAAVALGLIFVAWRVQAHINTLKNQSFIEGYKSAQSKCELDKANTIVTGSKIQGKVQDDVRKMQDPDVINALAAGHWLRQD